MYYSFVYSLPVFTHIALIDKYFPKVDNAFETNSDDETEMLPPSIPPPILSPIQSPSILSPSQMPITPSGKSTMMIEECEYHY